MCVEPKPNPNKSHLQFAKEVAVAALVFAAFRALLSVRRIECYLRLRSRK